MSLMAAAHDMLEINMMNHRLKKNYVFFVVKNGSDVLYEKISFHIIVIIYISQCNFRIRLVVFCLLCRNNCRTICIISMGYCRSFNYFYLICIRGISGDVADYGNKHAYSTYDTRYHSWIYVRVDYLVMLRINSTN